MLRLLISTGEVSGDLQGSLLVNSLYREAAKRSLSIEVLALGGKRMKKAGASLLADTTSISAIGLWEAIPLIMPTLRVQRKVDKFLKKSQLDAVVLIDYMGPNIRLGNKLRNLFPSIPIIYYIAPQEWAWRLGDGGTTKLITFTDKILAIFQAEADFYKERGGNVTWVGHPMLDTFGTLPDRKIAYEKLGLKSSQKLLLLFPASRKQELKYLLPVLLKTAFLLQQYDPSIYVLVPSSQEKFEDVIKQEMKNYGVSGNIVRTNQTDEFKPLLFSAASLAIGKSGTTNMELALNSVPQIVGYRLSKVTSFLANKILNFGIDHISPVNLLLKQRLIPEFVQKEFNENELFKCAKLLLENTDERRKILDGYKLLKKSLGENGVTNRAAKEILDLAQKGL